MALLITDNDALDQADGAIYHRQSMQGFCMNMGYPWSSVVPHRSVPGGAGSVVTGAVTIKAHSE